ncbi:MAG: SDR family NAD(P)-dependent oxidoreductase [Ignavibacteria bacterium]|jgi:NAD(P)-dependent dehydrogenase (short-subunit alcohol dehydrogenase family)
MELSGKNCLVTGASSGLGFEVSKKLAQLGANVIMLCRDKEKGEKVLLEIKERTPEASLEIMLCDLASMKSIEIFSTNFREKYSHLDILLNNAAVMKKNPTFTEDGFETMFQTNYLAPFIITNSLLDLLQKSSSAKIINIAVPSGKLRLDFNDLQAPNNYKSFSAFFNTKLCLLLFSLELSRRLNETSIKVLIVDPGAFKSNLVRESNRLMGCIKNLLSANVDKAAEHVISLMYPGNMNLKNGSIYVKGAVKKPIPYWLDEKISDELWSITNTMIIR